MASSCIGGKFQLLQVRCQDNACAPDGSKIEAASEEKYLGANISADGKFGGETVRRLGIANAEFRALNQFWKHTNVTKM